MAEIAVRILCEAWSDALSDPEAVATRAVNAAASVDPGSMIKDNEVSILFADAAFVRQLNRDYRGQDKPTNVLAFSNSAGCEETSNLLGDVVLAFELVCDEAEAQSKPISDHATHLIVHGLLHLLGFDHDTDQKAEEMEATEVSILSSLGMPDPYTALEARLSAAPDHG